jgi:(5-formylfuran-3-yl)methyl phosphate synthase
MPKLLVSVRNAYEAEIALTAGVDIIDVKEPRNGSLGAAAVDVIAQVLCLVDRRRPVSVALGELDDNGTQHLAKVAEQCWSNPPTFAKIGLAHCGARPGWQREFEAAMSVLPDETGRVAVAYVDFEAAASPPPDEILVTGRALGCRTALLDTFDKRGPGLLLLWSALEVAQWINAAREARMQAVVAGQLSIADCKTIAAYKPDYIGVRGAACWPGRCGQIDARRIAQLRVAVSGEDSIEDSRKAERGTSIST